MNIECRDLNGWHGARTPDWERIKAPFGGNWLKTLDKLESEVEHLEGDYVIIELEGPRLKIRKDGWPYGDSLIDPPVAVSFLSDVAGPLRYQTDRYVSWKGNVHAVAMTLERLRAIDRYGTTSRSEQYSGFAALPSGGQSSTPAPLKRLAQIIGWTVEEVQGRPGEAVKIGQRRTHPDSHRHQDPQDHEDWLTVQDAKKVLDHWKL